ARAKTWEPLPKSKQLGIGVVILIAMGTLFLLWPSLGALKAPVTIYVLAIAVMTVSAIYSTYAPALAVTGAISFLISDGTIAINKFLVPFELSSPLIWITYILAQSLLTLALIKGADKKNTSE
ncbi:MAG: lysoplasmalogenase, partial [Sneathiella sp.]|nr:lysoplasmalogenase [Sneathiella sp.]